MPTVMSLRVIPSVRTRPSRVLPASKIWTGVAEWEEPRHSGRLLDGTVPHFLPLGNTISHSSVRLTPCWPDCALRSETRRVRGRARGPFLQFPLHRQGPVPQPRRGSRRFHKRQRTRTDGRSNLMKRRLRAPSPSMVVALIALFVSLGGSAYAVATIGSDDIINGSIRNRDFKDGTLRGQEAKRDGFGGGSIKETSLDSTQIEQVPSAVGADGLTHHAVISNVGATVRS